MALTLGEDKVSGLSGYVVVFHLQTVQLMDEQKEQIHMGTVLGIKLPGGMHHGSVCLVFSSYL